ncbi:cutinase transcription factor 1 beta [Trichoderma arundinaceum]|uniref:Cutinase transcription factor 1 beta n=1 Tax=Trichoderma arundinaceum TaxID=490622 RepID=A0A395NPI1_TRIAR|nr:cutinase transcription factor 1 beta [Trichoderma arundinaceum]
MSEKFAVTWILRRGRVQTVGSTGRTARYGPGNPIIATPDSITLIEQARVVASVIANPSARTTWIYAGESGYGDILDILRPGSPACRHISINGSADTALNAEDLEYLNLKGCFNLPTKSDDLITAYFHFVHPIFPILDGPSFLQDYAKSGPEGMNLLLIWAMFSVSSSYVPMYSGKETKALFAMRGKVLFDLSGENDKIVLIQSALLLSFWFDDAEDIKQSWYWSGIAFSMAQTLGLHHLPAPDTPQISRVKYNNLKNLWHCCILRDSWLSHSMGRPLRLYEAARSTTLVHTNECRFRAMQLHANYMYSEAEAEGFEKMWQSSITAAHILRQCQSISSKPTESSTLALCLRDSLQAQQDTSSSFLLSLCSRHLQLCQHAALIAICQLIKDSEMIEAAVDGIVAVVKLYDDNTIPYVPPTAVPLIMPAMLISVSALRSTELHVRELAERRLSFCFHFLDEIEKTYPAASIVKRLFDALHNTIRAQQSNV